MSSQWTVEVHLSDLETGEVFTVVRDGSEDVEMVLKLAGMSAMFIYNGKRAVSGKPLVDPIGRKLVYHAEMYSL